MKNFQKRIVKLLIVAIPIISAFAMNVSANTIASPRNGQPTPPKNLKKYRKF